MDINEIFKFLQANISDLPLYWLAITVIVTDVIKKGPAVLLSYLGNTAANGVKGWVTSRKQERVVPLRTLATRINEYRIALARKATPVELSVAKDEVAKALAAAKVGLDANLVVLLDREIAIHEAQSYAGFYELEFIAAWERVLVGETA